MLKDQSILAIQISYFGYGEVSICFLFRHVIVDATAAANFIKSWGAISCNGDGGVITDVTILDRTSSFPPLDDSGMSASSDGAHEKLFSSSETLKKRFTFEGLRLLLIAPVGKLNASDIIVVGLLDTIDGEGIDAWVTMSKEDMDKFEQDSAVIAYASFTSFV
ncbi:hypothetical protein Dsin_016663 [Dipteronia sinensis]|uniref:Uncharacterized protein n=1 Tax=Dipteronia sinensis TaxID=43782 RepID=A0AAE0E5Y7_9ROSI|nr:hypothetical protein Dsin_016663 [Dipteronia sinensis]